MTVTLTPSAGANSVFAGWSGACTGMGPCQVTMDAAKSVTATFELAPRNLTVVVSGSGGSVSLDPLGTPHPAELAAYRVLTRRLG